MELTFEEQRQPRPLALRWQIGVAFFAFILIGAVESALGVLIPSVRGHYNLDKATVGTFFLVSSAGYLTAAFSSGLLIEKFGYRLFLLFGTGLIGLAALTFSFMPPFPLFLLTFLLMGFGIATIDAGLNSYIAALPRNTALLNLLHAFYGIGALLGPLAASTILAVGWNWNTVYYFWLSIALVLLVNFGLLYDRPVPPTDHAKDKAQSTNNVMLDALRLRAVWLAGLFLFFYVGAEVSLGNWSYSFLTEERHEPTLLSGWAVSGYWFGLTLGRLTLAKLAERLRMNDRQLIQACLVGVTAGVLMVWIAPIGAVSAFGLWLVGFSFGPIFPTTIALMSNLAPARLLPSAIGFLASVGSIGASTLPWLAGNLAEGFGLWSLLPYVILLTALMLGFWRMLQATPKKG